MACSDLGSPPVSSTATGVPRRARGRRKKIFQQPTERDPAAEMGGSPSAGFHQLQQNDWPNSAGRRQYVARISLRSIRATLATPFHNHPIARETIKNSARNTRA